MSIPENKICSRCGINKPSSDYTIINDKRGKIPYLFNQCKKCKSEYQKSYQKKYDSEYAKKYRQNNQDKIKQWDRAGYEKRKKRWENFMKTQKCSRCGISDHRVLQWHHIDPSTKTMTIGAQARQGKWDQIMEEVKKCICVCANCHFILHAEECTGR